MSEILDMARDLGRALARTDEYQALRRAVEAADRDREMVEARNELERLQKQIEDAIRAGREPDEAVANSYEDVFGRLQAISGYQRLVAAQTNFDKIVARVNDTIARGLEDGAQSRIILPS